MRATLLFILLNFTFFLYSQELHPVKKYWMPNGNVNVIERDTINDLIYLGGSFTSVGPQVGHGALLTTTANIPDFSFPIPNGRVLKSIADGNGGWYLSGEFTKIGDSLRDGLCHILANGVVDTLFRTKSVVGIIKALHLKDSTLFIGGIMEAFGETKKNGALFNTNNNVPLNYFPETDGAVRVSIPDGNGGLYIGGQFTNVGDSIRNNIAHVDNLGNVTSWNPSINGTVKILQLSSGHIFIGGDFDLINGQTRTKLGSVLALDGTLTNWNPNISGDIASIKVYGDTVYLGGNFTLCWRILEKQLSSSRQHTWGALLDGTLRQMVMSQAWNFIMGS